MGTQNQQKKAFSWDPVFGCVAQVLITIATRIINFWFEQMISLDREGRFKALLCFQAKGIKTLPREGMKLGVTGDYREVKVEKIVENFKHK